MAVTERTLIRARIAEYEAERASLAQRETAARHATDQAATEIARIDALLPMIESRYNAMSDLAERGYAARLRVQELHEEVTSLLFERRAQADAEAKAAAEIAMLQRDQIARREAFRRAAAEELVEAETIIATRRELLQKAERREQLQTLTAPVSGTVNAISVTTIGEMVEPGQPLVTLVPEGDELIIEAFLLNQDVGFIKPGDPAVIKLAAYPFTRYGHIEGEVEHISADSLVDERRGLVYPARIRMTGAALRLGALGEANGTVPRSYHDLLQAGLAATVEIKTGERSILSYLLSPIGKATSEAGRER